jgi:hypothetical protein
LVVQTTYLLSILPLISQILAWISLSLFLIPLGSRYDNEVWLYFTSEWRNYNRKQWVKAQRTGWACWVVYLMGECRWVMNGECRSINITKTVSDWWSNGEIEHYRDCTRCIVCGLVSTKWTNVNYHVSIWNSYSLISPWVTEWYSYSYEEVPLTNIPN